VPPTVRPLAVTILVENLPVPFDRRVWCEASALRDAGCHVSVVAPRGNGQRWHETLEGIEVCRYPAPPSASGSISYAFEFGWCWIASFLWAVRLLVTRGIDVIHACNPPDTLFGIALLLRPLGVKFVYDQHDLCPELLAAKYGEASRTSFAGRVLSWLERRTYAAADLVISPNESYADVARKRGRMREGRVFVVRSAPPRDRFELPERPSLRWRRGHRHLVGYIGVMGVQDGVDHLLRAAHRIVHGEKRTDVGFLLIGSGDELEAAQQLSAELGLTEHVEFTGRINDLAEIADALGSTDVCVCPDPHNPFNDVSSMNKVVEYMALGKPVAAYGLTETRATLADGGVYAAQPTPEGLANAIGTLLDDPAMRARMGRANRERFLDVLTWEHQVPRLLAAYRALGLVDSEHATETSTAGAETAARRISAT
jgi:glycosyltransferase involved in cell wall biosynthesis